MNFADKMSLNGNIAKLKDLFKSAIEPGLIGLSLLVITWLHYRWAQNSHSIHFVLQFLYYLPVIYSGFRSGIKGGLIAAVLTTIAYSVHFPNNSTLPDIINHVSQITLINIIGLVTGILSSSEKKLAERYWELSLKQQELISELEQSNIAVAQINEELANEIAERKILEESLRRSERLSAMGHLAAGVAHEMRNPLGIIRATMQVLEAEEKENKSVSECALIIKEECDRMNGVVEEFLRFARPAAPRFTKIDFSDLIDDVLLFTSKYLSSRGIDLDKRIVVDNGMIWADADQLKQVVLNLILNAADAMPVGGTLGITVQNKNERNLQLVISDTGQGISADHLSQIFDPFFSTKPKGTGLGLSIVCRILENHNGTIEVESKEGLGTEFDITLPLGEERDDDPDSGDR